MTTTKTIFKDYNTYLTDTGYTRNSADQYCSYLRKACELFNLGEGFPEAIIAITDTNVRASLCEYLMARLSQELKNTTDKAVKDKISKYKSSVAIFSEFVSPEDDAEPMMAATTSFMPAEDDSESMKTTSASFLPAVALPCESVYEKKDLMRIFKSRLVTQDRYYYGDNNCFPARIINRIATKNKVRDLYKKLILNTKFIYKADKYKVFLLREIDKLTIKADGFVTMEVKGKEYDIYTEIWKNKKLVGYDKLRVSSIRYISLDHVVSVHSKLTEFLKTHPEFSALSNHVMNYKNNSRDTSASDFSVYYFNNHYSELSVDESVMLDEIAEFINKLELSILHKSFNSSKNDIV